MLSIRETLCTADDMDKTVILPLINPYPSILYSEGPSFPTPASLTIAMGHYYPVLQSLLYDGPLHQ